MAEGGENGDPFQSIMTLGLQEHSDRTFLAGLFERLFKDVTQLKDTVGKLDTKLDSVLQIHGSTTSTSCIKSVGDPCRSLRPILDAESDEDDEDDEDGDEEEEGDKWVPLKDRPRVTEQERHAAMRRARARELELRREVLLLRMCEVGRDDHMSKEKRARELTCILNQEKELRYYEEKRRKTPENTRREERKKERKVLRRPRKVNVLKKLEDKLAEIIEMHQTPEEEDREGKDETLKKETQKETHDDTNTKSHTEGHGARDENKASLTEKAASMALKLTQEKTGQEKSNMDLKKVEALNTAQCAKEHKEEHGRQAKTSSVSDQKYGKETTKACDEDEEDANDDALSEAKAFLESMARTERECLEKKRASDESTVDEKVKRFQRRLEELDQRRVVKARSKATPKTTKPDQHRRGHDDQKQLCALEDALGYPHRWAKVGAAKNTEKDHPPGSERSSGNSQRQHILGDWDSKADAKKNTSVRAKRNERGCQLESKGLNGEPRNLGEKAAPRKYHQKRLNAADQEVSYTEMSRVEEDEGALEVNGVMSGEPQGKTKGSFPIKLPLWGVEDIDYISQ
ncbi:cylicin-2-like [Engraulis encrasicolus]|uniref:cylicin-2-like n=1 Tax=Engraulis encrasicolus TaxID=184585 RepID=UPI002FD45439